MKNIFLLSIAALILSSCGGKKGDESLAQLQTEKDSLLTAHKTISSRLKEIELDIKRLDTSAANKTAIVNSMKISKMPFEHFIRVQATVAGDKEININPEFGGLVRSILVTEGQNVAAGQSLAILDGDIMQKNMEELKTGYELAVLMYNKQKALWDSKVGSEVQYLQAKNQKESLEKRMSSLNAQIAKSIIRAPFAGTVDKIYLKVGELAAPQLPLIKFVNLGSVKVVSEVSENYLKSIKVGDSVLIHLPSIDKKLRAKISSISNVINRDNRTFRVEVLIQNPDNQMKPNMFGMLMIRDYVVPNSITVPSKAIMQDPQGNDYIFVIKNNIATKTIIKVGQNYNDVSEIISGLTEGEEIVLEGGRSIISGELVSVIETK